MKKLDNKGLTLIELLVTVILLSVVLLSSYGLVRQLLYIKDNNSIANDNQIYRSLIIDTIQSDLIYYGMSYTSGMNDGFTVTKGSSNIVFKLTNYKGISTITLTKDTLVYKDFTGKEDKWTFKNCYSSVNAVTYSFDYTSFPGYAFMQIKIPIYTNNTSNNGSPNNNVNDDIILTYYGKYFKV